MDSENSELWLGTQGRKDLIVLLVYSPRLDKGESGTIVHTHSSQYRGCR